jgi:hypothetical protein
MGVIPTTAVLHAEEGSRAQSLSAPKKSSLLVGYNK